MSRITNDVAQIQNAVSETVGDLMRESLSIVGYAGGARSTRTRGWRSCA